MKPDKTSVCPVCKKRRGGSIKHDRCSRLLQKQKLAETSKPYVWPDGKVGKTKDGEVYTVEKQAHGQAQRQGRLYKEPHSDAFWKNYD